jgi:hypothetical protein
MGLLVHEEHLGRARKRTTPGMPTKAIRLAPKRRKACVCFHQLSHEPLTGQENPAPVFSDPPHRKLLGLTDKRRLRFLVENATRRRMEKKVVSAPQDARLPPFFQGFAPIVSSF